MGERSLRHGAGDRLADGAVGGDQIGWNADQIGLGLVGIGHEPALDHGRGAGDLRQQGGHETAGAGFGRRDLQALRLVGIEQRGGAVLHLGRHESSSGRRIVAAAWAAMPSDRPVKPSFSVVVAFSET